MERLTKRMEDGTPTYAKLIDALECKEPWSDSNYRAVLAGILEKLADYEDADEYGTLVKYPCKIGSILYWVYPEQHIRNEEDCVIHETIVDGFTDYGDYGDGLYFMVNGDEENSVKEYLGTEAFLTREEAEEVLAKRKELALECEIPF